MGSRENGRSDDREYLLGGDRSPPLKLSAAQITESGLLYVDFSTGATGNFDVRANVEAFRYAPTLETRI